eukprot:scaffold1452_cov236-Pinguiococcus_pyrenoidosus.AAC.15
MRNHFHRIQICDAPALQPTKHSRCEIEHRATAHRAPRVTAFRLGPFSFFAPGNACIWKKCVTRLLSCSGKRLQGLSSPYDLCGEAVRRVAVLPAKAALAEIEAEALLA